MAGYSPFTVFLSLLALLFALVALILGSEANHTNPGALHGYIVAIATGLALALVILAVAIGILHFFLLAYRGWLDSPDVPKPLGPSRSRWGRLTDRLKKRRKSAKDKAE